MPVHRSVTRDIEFAGRETDAMIKSKVSCPRDVGRSTQGKLGPTDPEMEHTSSIFSRLPAVVCSSRNLVAVAIVLGLGALFLLFVLLFSFLQ